MIDPDVREFIEPELITGEKILWADKPQGLSFYLGAMWGLSTILVFLMAFAALFTSAANQIIKDLFADFDEIGFQIFVAGVALFFLIGIARSLHASLAHLFGPFNQAYALTNKRGLIVSRFPKRSVESLGFEILAKVERRGNEDIGTLHFGSRRFWYNEDQRPDYGGSFHNICNPKIVEALIFDKILPQNGRS